MIFQFVIYKLLRSSFLLNNNHTCLNAKWKRYIAHRVKKASLIILMNNSPSPIFFHFFRIFFFQLSTDALSSRIPLHFTRVHHKMPIKILLRFQKFFSDGSGLQSVCKCLLNSSLLLQREAFNNFYQEKNDYGEFLIPLALCVHEAQ